MRHLARCQQRYIEPKLHRLKGELMLQSDGHKGAAHAVEQCFRQAIGVAKQHGSRSFELRAATSLARLWHRRKRSRDSRALLSDVYDGFTEGHATRDLLAAGALLTQLRR